MAAFAVLAPAAQADPGQGPGGPILVVTGDSNPFGRYYAEILRTEGLNEFDVAKLSDVTQAMLDAHDVVVLGETPLTGAEATMFDGWVNAGGNLIAMRPDAHLGSLLGITPAASTLPDAYMKVDTTSAPGAGIVADTMQFHGTADRYTLSGASAVATLYADASTATTSPAVTVRSVGSNGGQAAAFTYDLARSVVYTRQGNPAWAGQERDGVAPIRPDDLFFGAAAADPQADWVDLDKVQIPQADEQQRLLANLIEQLNTDRKPLPRFWYFPRDEKAVIVMTGDDHAGGGTAGRFDLENAASPTGCVVADWQCVRSTSYIYDNTPLTDAQAAAYQAQGFEIALHPNTGCADYTPAQFDTFLAGQLASFASTFPSLSDPATSRTHCIAWSGWVAPAQSESDHGIRFDTNYYYWPASWIQDRPGMFTGSGMPMRFAGLDGSMVDVYQAVTQMTDESGQSYPATSNALLDNALGPKGYYGAFTANMHNDSATSDGWQAITASAQARGVPVVSSRQMLDWIDARNNSSFGSIAWTGSTLQFTIQPDAAANGLRAMVPTQSAAGGLTGVTRGGSPVTTTTRMIKGVEYAFINADAGSYEASYAPDATPPTISAVSATARAGGTATVTWQTDEPADSRVDYGTSPSALSQSESSSASTTSHSVELNGLDAATTYHFRVTSKDAGLNASTSPSAPFAPATFATPANGLTDTTVADFSAGSTGSGTYVSETANGEVSLAPTEGSEFSGSSLPPGWFEAAWPSGGDATVAGGQLTVDGARAGTTATYAAGRALEFSATFSSSVPFAHIGFGTDYNAPPWAMFSVKGDGNLYARTDNNSGSSQETQLPAGLLGSPHVYRIDWQAGDVRYSVDGVLLATHSISLGATELRPLASDYSAGGGGLMIDWLRMSPYTGAGTFTSRVLDAGGPAEWSSLDWAADLPAGTSVALSVRTGDTATPDDGSWSAFTPIASSGGDVPGNSRYAQYRAVLTTSDPNVTPTLGNVTITLDRNPVAVADSRTVSEDSGPNTVGVLANDTDPDGGTRTIASRTNGTHGAVTITNGGQNLTYAPDPGYCNTDASGPGSGPPDAFTYTLNGGSTATVSVTVTCSRTDLQVTKTADADPVTPGDHLVYTIVTRNNGSSDGQSDAHNATMIDALPAATTFVSTDDPANCSVVTQTITCSYGTLATGATRTVHVTVAVDPAQATTFHNDARVTTSTTDTDPANNTDGVDTHVAPRSDVTIHKSSDRSSYQDGDLVTWKLQAHNDGPSTAQNVTVDDDIPANLSFVSVSPGTPDCTQLNGHVHCDLGALTSGADRTVTVVTRAHGAPGGSMATVAAHTHKITVSKEEQYWGLQPGETRTMDVTCSGAGTAADGAVQIVDVDQGRGTPADVHVLQASSIAPGTYRFVVDNTTSGQAQVRAHLTCLPAGTDPDTSVHPLLVGGLHELATGSLAPGRHSFTLPVDAQHRAVAQGMNVLSGAARLVGSEPVGGGWKFTVDVQQTADVKVSLRLLDNTTGAAGSPTHVHPLLFQHIARTVSIGPGRTNQLRVSCPVGYKGIVGTYDLPPGVVALGSVPEPINRDFDLYNANDHAVDATLDLECISIETGQPVGAGAETITNTGTVATTTLDSDHGNDTGSATITVSRAAGPSTPVATTTLDSDHGNDTGSATVTVSGAAGLPSTPVTHVARPRFGTVSIASTGATVTVPVSCSGNTTCSGTVTLTASVSSSTRAASTARLRKVVLGKAKYKVKPGKKASVTVKVASRYRKTVASGKVKKVGITSGKTSVTAKAVVKKGQSQKKN